MSSNWDEWKQTLNRDIFIKHQLDPIPNKQTPQKIALESKLDDQVAVAIGLLPDQLMGFLERIMSTGRICKQKQSVDINLNLLDAVQVL
jgi:hypothetical protein